MAGAHDPTAAHIPFGVHQVVELLLGILLLVQGARTGEHTAIVVGLGGLLLLLALCSAGPLGAWPWIGRRLHRVLDVVVAAVLALSPLVLGLDHVLPIVIVEVAAAAMLWLALRTQWRAPAPRRRRGGASPSARSEGSAPAAPAPQPPEPAAPAPQPGAPAAPVARKLGAAVGKARDDGPRQLGRFVGRVQRAAKAAKEPGPTPDPRPEPPSDPGAPSQG